MGFCLLVTAGCEFSSAPSATATVATIASTEMAVQDGLLVLSSPYEHRLRVFDTSYRQWRQAIDLPGRSGTVAVQGDHVAITLPDIGRVQGHGLQNGNLLWATTALQHPWSIVPHDGAWWVSDVHAQAIIRLVQGVETHRFSLPFQPGALLIAKDQLYVAGRHSGDLWAMPLDMRQPPSTHHTQFPNITQQIDQLAWFDDQLWAVAQLADTGADDRLARFDTAIRPALLSPGQPPRFLDDSGNVLSRPIALGHDSGSNQLWIAGANSHSVQRWYKGQRQWLFGEHLDLGDVVRGLWVNPADQHYWAWLPLSFSLHLGSLEDGSTVTAYPVTPPPELDNDWLAGARWFHTAGDARVSRGGWLACDSCHPDGGHDGQVWRMASGWRNTQALGGALKNLPLHWDGDRDHLQDFDLTFRRLMGGRGFLPDKIAAHDIHPGDSEALDQLTTYIASLPVIAGQGNIDEASVQRGSALFVSAGCAACHQLGQDFAKASNTLHNVGTGGAYDVPSLRGVAFTAPYLHDGRAASLEAVLTDHNDQDQHGRTQHLSVQERADLVVFMNSL